MRKRSSYRPKPVQLDTMAWVKSGFKKLVDMTDENTVVRVKNHGALRSMVDGTGTREDADILIAALNMTEALARLRQHLGTDWMPEIQAGLDALHAMCQRALTRDRFLFTGPELAAVNQAVEIHDAQLDACTVAELEGAMALVAKIKSTGKARPIEKELTA